MRIFFKSFFWFCIKIVYRPKIMGKENIPKTGAALICPNHVHALDPAVIVAGTKRKVNVLAKESLFKGKFRLWMADLFGIYPIKQNSADIEAIKISLRLLKTGELLLVYPEGTRNGLEKNKPLKNGPMTLSLKTGAPIIPVGIKGSFKPFRKVIINIGKPLNYCEYKDKIKDKEFIAKLTKEMMNEVIKLRDEIKK